MKLSLIAAIALCSSSALADQYPRTYERDATGQNFIGVEYFSMFACNAGSDKTNIRKGPSASKYPTIGKLLNGQEVSVVEKITNPDGYDYYEIVFQDALSGGRLYDEVGYVYHEALATSCSDDFRETLARNTQWPVISKIWGCQFSFENQDVMDRWGNMSSELHFSAMPQVERALCREADAEFKDEKISIANYLGFNQENNRHHFQLKMNTCDAELSIGDNGNGNDFSYGWVYNPVCLQKLNKPKISAVSGDVPSKGFFSQWWDNMFGGMADSDFTNKMSDPKYTYCWSIDNEDARNACLEEPWMTENEDARQVLLGNCFGLSKWAEDFGLTQICAYPGKPSCTSIRDSDISYACYSCDGSRRWVATAAAGHIFECY